MPVTGTTWGRVRKERGAARIRVGGALLVLLALAPAFGAYLVFAKWMPDSAERYDAYRVATACGSGPDCLRTVPLRIDDVSRSQRGGTRLTLTMTEAPFRTYRTSLASSGPVAGDLHEGDEVEATVWRGDLVVLAQDGKRQPAVEEPSDEPQPQAALGTFAALLTAQLLTRGTLRLARPYGYRRLRRAPYATRVLLAMGAVSAAVGFLSTWADAPWQLVPPLAVLLSAAVTYLILNWQEPPTRQNRAQKVGSAALPPS